jgi:hypothetical protein
VSDLGTLEECVARAASIKIGGVVLSPQDQLQFLRALCQANGDLFLSVFLVCDPSWWERQVSGLRSQWRSEGRRGHEAIAAPTAAPSQPVNVNVHLQDGGKTLTVVRDAAGNITGATSQPAGR